MKFNVLIGVMSIAVAPSLAALESIASLPVALDVNAKFGMTVGAPLFSGSSQTAGGEALGSRPSGSTIDLGTFDFDHNPPNESLEIYCSSNTGNSWQIDIEGEAFRNVKTGSILSGSPVYWSFGPEPKNPGDFQKAQGVFFSGALPTSGILYRSSPGETGAGILVVLGVNANLRGLPEAGTYQTLIRLSMHE